MSKIKGVKSALDKLTFEIKSVGRDVHLIPE